MSAEPQVIWHDLECGAYRQDLRLWTRLARDSGDPILDVGAGTGRVSLELARRGHRVVALDHDPVLLAALRERAQEGLAAGGGGSVSTVCADARDFRAPGGPFALCAVPMQTIQLLGGRPGRARLLACVLEHLAPGGVLAISIAPEFDEFGGEEVDALPLPDMVEIDGCVYASQPTAVRRQDEQVILERRREVVSPSGDRRVSDDLIALDLLGPGDLLAEASAAGLRPVASHTVPETDEHVGSLVVIFRAP
ncbi:MAG TPA: class I SAM-dependent methyltransferase [Solirubrobacteraceae bacterium]|nr:class I SAM-dependent methyltransferase [Solirubrobacteraceae bacterium]